MNIISKMELLNEKIKDECKISNIDYYETSMKKQGFFIGFLFIKTECENKRKIGKITPIKVKEKEIENSKLSLASNIFKKGTTVKKLIERINKWNDN